MSEENKEVKMLKYDDFCKIDIRLGTVKSCERVPKSDKLLKLQVNFGEFERQIIAGIGETFQPGDLVGKQYTFITNLEPRKIFGLESNGMILAAGADSKNLILFGSVESKYTSCCLPNTKLEDGTKLG